MGKVTIYHNPRCSKSRQTLQLLRDRGIEPEVVEYLKDPPTREELDQLLRRLECEPRELMRRKEAPYAENRLDDPALTREQLVDAMVQNPILIERPVVVVGRKAAVGRPPERVLDLLPR